MRRGKKLLIVLFIIQSVALKAYATLPVVDIPHIVESITQFAQTLQQYKLRIREYQETYLRISNAAKAIASGDWEKALKGVASVTEEVAAWKVTNGIFDDILLALSSGNTAALDIYSNTLNRGKNIHDTWLGLQDNIKSVSSKNKDLTDWEYMDLVVTSLLDSPATVADIASQSSYLLASDLSSLNRTNSYLLSINDEIEVSLKKKLEEAKNEKSVLEDDLQTLRTKIQRAIEGQRDTEKEQLRELRNEKEATLEALNKNISEMEKKLSEIENSKKETELTDFTTSTLDNITEAVNKLTWDLYEEKTFSKWYRTRTDGYNL